MRKSREPERVCAVRACRKLVTSRGYCSGHYQRVRRYGDPEGRPAPPKTAFDILQPVIGEALAKEVIALREAKGRAKPFDAYRATITLKTFQRASEPRLSAWEYIHRLANRRELTLDYLKACVSYDAETGLFVSRLPLGSRQEGDILGSEANNGYLGFSVAGKPYLAHRLAWFYEYGYWPELVDHIDRDRHNNRLSNLRECGYTENAWNVTPKKGTVSGVQGVNWFAARNKWVAKIHTQGASRTLGYFDTVEEAAAERARAVEKYRGHFLNAGEVAA